jgi:hypothetical protein
VSDREREISRLIGPYLAERAAGDIALMAAAFRERFDEALITFQNALRFCAAATSRQREKSDKGNIRYVAISTLDSGLLTKTLDVRIDFLDGRLWLDESEAAAYWLPRIAAPFIRFPRDEVWKKLTGSLNRVMDYELEALEREYRRIPRDSLMSQCRELIQRSTSIIRAAGADKRVDVLFGPFMELGECIAVLSEDDSEERI